MKRRWGLVAAVVVVIGAGFSCERRTEVEQAMDRVEKKVEEKSQ